MIPAQTLGRLNTIHQLLTQLVQDLPAAEVNQQYLPGSPSLGWLLGRSIYLETLWVREKLQNDNDLTQRVSHIFDHQANPASPEIQAQIPPRDHLLNWALEIQEENLTLLANTRLLPEHPWLQDGWLGNYLVQVHSRIYEEMVSQLAARAVSLFTPGHTVKNPIRPAIKPPETIEISQGHYRIGARDGVVFDNEQPLQIVELNNFRICNRPVNNAEYLSFMEAGGYHKDEYWEQEGQQWIQHSAATHPWHWRQDEAGNWYAIGLNGPVDLHPEDPVNGISLHEAHAFANWASAEVNAYKGAILQHEYQWEVAARTQGLKNHGRAWEWCKNHFDAYDQYEAPADAEMRTQEFDHKHYSRRGGCLHTQPELRRASYRQSGLPGDRHLFTSTRLVLPPAHEQDALYIEQWQKFLN